MNLLNYKEAELQIMHWWILNNVLAQVAYSYSKSKILITFVSLHFHFAIAILFSFNSGYLYQVVVRIPLRFARVIRPGSGWRLGRAYGARPFNLHILRTPWELTARPRPCPRPTAAWAPAIGLSSLSGYDTVCDGCVSGTGPRPYG